MDAKEVLIVYHSQGGNTKAAAEKVAEGVSIVDGVDPVVKAASEAGAADLVGCQAICVGTPDYFSYMAGMLKDFFDRTYYPTQGQVDGKPCGIFVTHGGGGKAAASVESICRSFKFTQIGKTVLVKDRPDKPARDALRNLGIAVAEAVL